jgi:hypothetical protein
MNPPNDNTTPRGLRGWWASPPRSGMQRIILPFQYRHLRFWAGWSIAAGVVLAGLGAVTLAFGGNNMPTYGWTAFWLAMAAASFAVACWFLAIVRSASPRT